YPLADARGSPGQFAAPTGRPAIARGKPLVRPSTPARSPNGATLRASGSPRWGYGLFAHRGPGVSPLAITGRPVGAGQGVGPHPTRVVQRGASRHVNPIEQDG